MQQQLTALRTATTSSRDDAATITSKSAELLTRRGDKVLELAQHFLPELSREAAQSVFAGIRGELLAVVERKDARQREIAAQIEQLTAEEKRQQAELESTTAALNAKAQQRETLRGRLTDLLKAKPDFVALSQETLAAKENLRQNEARVAELQREAAEKLPAYEHSRLFTYLRRRRYGTAEYHAPNCFGVSIAG